MAELLDHAFQTPNGMACCVAPTVRQLEQTVKKEFFRQCPDRLIESYRVKDSEVVLTNGFSFLFYVADSPVKIRSLNLTAFLMEEASGISYEIFTVLQTRLRNPHAVIYKRDSEGNIIRDTEGKAIVSKEWYLGIICSNPDVNWVRSQMLLHSHKIYCTNPNDYYVETPVVYFSSHITKTEQNKYLPPNFIPMLKANKPEWWIKRYLEGDFSYAEGMVYPMIMSCVVAPFPIPRDWVRLSATDFGGRNPHCTLMLAIDPKEGVAYIYDEYYKAGLNVAMHQKEIHRLFDEVPSGRWYKPPLADPAGQQKSLIDGKSLFTHYAEYGIYFNPANNRIADGLAKVYTYFDMKKLKIFSNCSSIIKEGIEYRYPEQVENEKHDPSETPPDKNDHAMDALRYMIMELPDDPLSMCSVEGMWIDNPMSHLNRLNAGEPLPPWLMDNDESNSQLDWY